MYGLPVIVTGNNDGCAIARSNEAKALGVKLGDPWFKMRHLADSNGLVALSANFALYGDLSDRMMRLAPRARGTASHAAHFSAWRSSSFRKLRNRGAAFVGSNVLTNCWPE